MTESARIASLEAQMRTVRQILLCVFGLAVLAICIAFSNHSDTPDVVKAKRFQVINDKGEVLIDLLESFKRGRIIVTNGDENLIDISGDGAEGSIRARCVQVQKIEAVDGYGEALVLLEASNGKGRISTRSRDFGDFGSAHMTGSGIEAESIQVNNGSSDVALVELSSDRGNGQIFTRNSAGPDLIRLSATGSVLRGDAAGTFEILNFSGSSLLQFESEEYLESQMIIRSIEGRDLVGIGSVPGGGGVIEVYDESGFRTSKHKYN